MNRKKLIGCVILGLAILAGVFLWWDQHDISPSPSTRLLQRMEDAQLVSTISSTPQIYMSADKKIWFGYEISNGTVAEEAATFRITNSIVPEAYQKNTTLILKRLGNASHKSLQDFWKIESLKNTDVFWNYFHTERRLLSYGDREWFVVAADSKWKDGGLKMYTDCGEEICEVIAHPSEMFPIDTQVSYITQTFRFIPSDKIEQAVRIYEYQTKYGITEQEAKKRLEDNELITKKEAIRGWTLIDGNFIESCSSVELVGDVSIHGWYVRDSFYGKKEWVLYVAQDDVAKLPLSDEYVANKNQLKLKLDDASKEVETKLRQASEKNPYALRIRKYSTYCEGLPAVSIGTASAKVVSPADTSDWKTYRNEEYGFEISYPNDYGTDENNQWPSVFQVVFLSKIDSKKMFGIEVFPGTRHNQPLEIYLDSPTLSKTTIDGLEANVFFLEQGYCDGPNICSPPINAFTVYKDEKDYAIYFHDFQGSKDDVLIKILNNIHFF